MCFLSSTACLLARSSGVNPSYQPSTASPTVSTGLRTRLTKVARGLLGWCAWLTFCCLPGLVTDLVGDFDTLWIVLRSRVVSCRNDILKPYEEEVTSWVQDIGVRQVER